MSPKTKPLLSIIVMPNFATGDLASITVHQDLDADGNLDYSATVGGGGRMVTSLCGNGLILCQPGTFSGCEYRQWTLTPAGGVTTSAVGSDGAALNADDLFNCYCFNNHCSRYNNSSALNSARLVQDIGGTVASTLMQGRPDLAIASVSAAETSISYYGTKASGASSVPGISAPRLPNKDYTKLPVLTANSPDDAVSFYSDAEQLSSRADTENAAMAQVPGSLFSIVTNTQKAGGTEILKCSVRREASLSSRTVTKSTTLPEVQHKARKFVKTRIIAHGGERFVVDLTDVTLEKGCGDNTTDILPPYQDPNGLSTSLQLMEASCFIRETIGADTSTTVSMVMTPSTGLSSSPWQTVTGISLSSEDCGNVYVTCTMKGTYTVEEYSDTVSNGCSTLASDPDCRLREEMWDGRPYISNFVETGFALAENCKDFAGSTKTHRICRPWWRQDRTYVCDRQSPSNNFDSYLNSIRPSVKAISDGAEAAETGFANCEKACRVKAPTSDTLVRRDQVDSDLKQQDAVTASSNEYFVKTCTIQGGVDTCPVDAASGEVLVEGCACIDDFGDAAAAMQALKQAADDAVCSSTTPSK